MNNHSFIAGEESYCACAMSTAANANLHSKLMGVLAKAFEGKGFQLNAPTKKTR
jgi:hypothetical protein